MRELFRPVLFMAIVLAIPVVPFLLFGAQMEQAAEHWQRQSWSTPVTAALVIGLLASDIFLPVPASAVSTLAGSQLGAIWGTLASWAGMTLGSLAGFSLARRYGKRFALWFTKEKDLARIQAISHRFGPATIILTRGVPVLAEASVLLMGIHQLPWRRFLPALILSNLGVSLAYAWFGEIAQRHSWLPLALGVSIALPVLLAAIAMRFLPREKETSANS